MKIFLFSRPEACLRLFNKHQVRLILLIVVLISLLAGVNALADWGKTIGTLSTDKGKSIAIDPRGGYLIAGQTEGAFVGTGQDVWLVKLDAAGNTVWERTYHIGDSDSVFAVFHTPDHGWFLAGTTSFETSAPIHLWLMKIEDNHDDADGFSDSDVMLLKTHTSSNAFSASQMSATSDGQYLIGGNRIDPLTGKSDFWVAKVENDGDIEWQKTYGGTNEELLTSIHEDSDGGIIMAGMTWSFGERNGDYLVIKTNAAGVVVWDAAYGLDGSVYGDQDPNENFELDPKILPIMSGGNPDGYLLAGTTAAWTGKYHVWVLKLTDAGGITWQNLYSSGIDCGIKDLSLNPGDTGYYIAGWEGPFEPINHNWDGFIMKLDASGTVVWTNNYGGDRHNMDDYIQQIVPKPDGGMMTIGSSKSLAVSISDMWIMNLNDTGLIPGCNAMQSPAVFLDTATAETPQPAAVNAGTPDSSAGTVTTTSPELFFKEGNGCDPTVANLVDIERTGQVQLYLPGDDGHIQAGVPWPENRFHNNGDGSITDNMTGLTWLKNANCFDLLPWIGGNYPNFNYPALDAALDFNVDPSTYCQGNGYTGLYRDWRLPNINELKTLMHDGVMSPSEWLMSQGFDNVQSIEYPSSTKDATWNGYIWIVNFDQNWVRSRQTSTPRPIWLVRSGADTVPDGTYPVNVPKTGQTASIHPGDDGALQHGVLWPSPRFLDNGDGTVTDNLTGLMWLKDANCFTLRYWEKEGAETALDVVEDFNQNPGIYGCQNNEYTAAHNDWRLPNRKEIFSLFDKGKTSVGGTTSLPEGHPFQNTVFENASTDGNLWSSTTKRADSQGNPSWAWGSYWNGEEQFFPKFTYDLQVWPVRGGTIGVPLKDADLDDDGDVDGADVELLSNVMGLESDDEGFELRFDLVRDGIIDELDLAKLAEHFGRTDCPCLFY